MSTSTLRSSAHAKPNQVAMNSFTLGTCCLVLTVTLLSSMNSTTAQTCGDICVHTFRYAPVCGSDGKTYTNKGELECERLCKPDLKLVHEGYCKEQTQQSREDCICTEQLELVCGSDGKTYENPCKLDCQSKYNPGLRMLYPGDCVERKTNQ